jgi:outer membrane protein assembly factor BamB
MLMNSRPRVLLRSLTVAALIAAMPFCSVVRAADLTVAELAGWWSAQLSHDGQQTEFAIHFVEENGKRIARLTIPVIGIWDSPFGEFETSGDQVTLKAFKLPLTADPARQKLTGMTPEEIIPVYRMPLEFRRVEPRAAPPSPIWNYPSPTQLWEYQGDGAIWAGLEFDPKSGQLFVGTDSGSAVALDAATGKANWTVKTGGRVRAQPTVIDAHVYISSDDGNLYKLEQRTGAIAWKARIDNGSQPRLDLGDEKFRWDRYGSAVATDGKRLYIGSRDGNVYALDPASGSEIWRFRTGDMVTGTPAVHGDLVLFSSFDKYAYAVKADDATLQWKRDLKGELPSDVVIAENRALIGSRSYDLNALEPSSGETRWQRYVWFSWIESAPNIRDGIAYVGTSDALKLFAFDVKDGRMAWERTLPGWSWSRPAVQDNCVIAGAVGAKAYSMPREGALLAISRTNGAIQWMFPAPPVEGAKQWGFGSSPVATARAVYAADLSGRVYAFSLGTQSGS